MDVDKQERAYIISRLLSLFLVTTSVSEDPDPLPASSFLSLAASSFLSVRFSVWRAEANCQAGMDGGTAVVVSGLANCFLLNILDK